MRRFVCCALLGAVALVLAGSPSAASAPGQRDAALEQGILRELNRVRVAHGLAALQPSAALRSAALYQSRSLLAQGVFAHDTPGGGAFSERLRRFYPVAGATSWVVGENLLWSTAGITPAEAVKLWLESPAHRKVMLDASWRELGVAAVLAPDAPGVFARADGPVVVVTVDFGARAGGSRLTAAARSRG